MSVTSSASTTVGWCGGSGSNGAQGISDMSLSLSESTMIIAGVGLGPALLRRQKRALTISKTKHMELLLRSIGGTRDGRYMSHRQCLAIL